MHDALLRILNRILIVPLVTVMAFSQDLPRPIQTFPPSDMQYVDDKCGYDPVQALAMAKLLGNGFGYGYDSLLVDLDRWLQSPFVSVDSIGASVLNRALWQLTITDTSAPAYPRYSVFIHARTHPNEVQGWWVTDEIINLLVGDDPYARMMRDSTVFYIVPMYNPDGVELGYNRQNAHYIDIESNWSADTPEPEVVALRQRFTDLMASPSPIRVALNMHAAFNCVRYFVYHHEVGTSLAYTVLEKQFIGGVRSHFPHGIEPWDFFVSWTNSTPGYYPESWFWLNHGKEVMALTYEDMNCPEAGKYDSTAIALLHGIGDYLGLPPLLQVPVDPITLPVQYVLYQNYPNPFNDGTVFSFFLPASAYGSFRIYDLLGNEVARLKTGYLPSGNSRIFWDARDSAGRMVPSGAYIARLSVSEYSGSIRILLLK